MVYMCMVMIRNMSWINRVDFKIKSELPIINLAKAKAAISPNSIHNLDSLHLMLVIDECDFDIVTCSRFIWCSCIRR